MNTSFIFQLIENYGLIAVFAMIMLEYACFPVPSEIVLPLAGAYASFSGIPFLAILLASVAAGLCGSMICYSIGRYGGGAILSRVKHRPSIRSGIDASTQWFEKYGGASVMIGRVLPLCRTYISFVAGLTRQNVLSFLAYSAAGIAVWNVVLVGLGFKLADHWEVISVGVRKYSYIVLPVVLVLLFVVFCRIKKRAAGKK